MPKGHIMMAMTLDGFIARANHALDWLTKMDTEGEDHGFAAFLDSIDVIVMGANTFRTVLSFGQWPYDRPVIILSHGLTADDIPDPLTGKVEISALPPDALMADLSARGWDRVYLDGGAVVQSFLRAGHVAEMKVTLVPILIGDGIRLFGALDRDIDLELVEARPFPSGLVDLLYRVA